MLVERTSKGSVSNKVFIRSTKAGDAIKVFREQYLRTDIPCGSKLCPFCPANTPPKASGDVLVPVLSLESNSTQKRGPHYILIDTNVALRAIDLLEHQSCFYDVIVPQTTLEEVKNRSIPIYSRLRSLVSAHDKRFYVFHNSFHAEAAVERMNGETINDFNDRAIRKVAKWYVSHFEKYVKPKSAIPEIILVTNDRANMQLALKEGTTALSLETYISEHPNANTLLNMVPEEKDSSILKESGASLYAEHYTRSQLLGGLKNNTLFQGKLNISRYNYLEASVSTPTYPKELFVLGKEDMNRAFDGDIVVVELLPKSKWKRPLAEITDEQAQDAPRAEAAEDDVVETIVSDRERAMLAKEALSAQESTAVEYSIQPTAKVVGIIRRNWRFYVGHIRTPDNASSKGLRNVLFKPLDKRIPHIRIKTRQTEALVNQRIVVAVDDWPSNSRNPEGHFVRLLGETESKDAETEAILIEHDIEYRAFPKAALDCLPQEGHDWKPGVNDPKFSQRQDLRDLLICSIDPPNCQDIDDALHASPLPNGNFEVGVHIADVTHFVRPDTALDFEGSIRATSTYLVDKRIDMLPSLLGTDLCSLKPDVERYAFSILWELDPEAKVVSTRFTKSLIRSRQAFEYEEAQARIDDTTKQDDLTKSMRILMALSKKLRKSRFDNGALNLASPEIKILNDSETAEPASVMVKKQVDTNALVEEFMLLANHTVASRILESFPQEAILRRHPAPPATNFDVLNDQLRIRGFPQLRVETSKSLATSLDELSDPNDPFFNTLIRIVATRCMVSAQYFVSGEFAPSEFRHYGLALDTYTHFTSPIRRYADVVAHRQLAEAIGYEDPHQALHQKNKLESSCDNMNRRHLNAQLAGRASIEYYVGQFLKGKNSTQEGYIIKVFTNGIVVLVPKFGLETVIKIENICKPEEAQLEEDSYTLRVRGDKPRDLCVFDKVDVYVESVLDEKTGKRHVKMSVV